MGKKGADKTNAELNKAVGNVVEKMTKSLLYKQIQDVNEDISMTGVKIINFDKPVTEIKHEGSTIVIVLEGIELRLEARWSKEKDNGALTAPAKAKITIKITSPDGLLNIDSATSMSEFTIRNDGDLSDANQDLLLTALRGSIKQNLDEVIRQSAVESVNDSKTVFNKLLASGVKAK